VNNDTQTLSLLTLGNWEERAEILSLFYWALATRILGPEGDWNFSRNNDKQDTLVSLPILL